MIWCSFRTKAVGPCTRVVPIPESAAQAISKQKPQKPSAAPRPFQVLTHGSAKPSSSTPSSHADLTGPSHSIHPQATTVLPITAPSVFAAKSQAHCRGCCRSSSSAGSDIPIKSTAGPIPSNAAKTRITRRGP